MDQLNAAADQAGNFAKKVNSALDPLNVVSGLISLGTMGEYSAGQIRGDIDEFLDSPLQNFADVAAGLPAGGGVSATARAASRGLAAGTLINITRRPSIANYQVRGTLSDFAAGLRGRGYQTSVSKDGRVQIFTRGDRQYVLRQHSKQGSTTVDVRHKGDPIAKVRLVQ